MHYALYYARIYVLFHMYLYLLCLYIGKCTYFICSYFHKLKYQRGRALNCTAQCGILLFVFYTYQKILCISLNWPTYSMHMFMISMQFNMFSINKPTNALNQHKFHVQYQIFSVEMHPIFALIVNTSLIRWWCCCYFYFVYNMLSCIFWWLACSSASVKLFTFCNT